MINIKNLLKKTNLTIFGFVSITTLLFKLEAIEISTEFFTNENLPECYRQDPAGDYWTIITVKDWPSSSVEIFEKKLSLEEETKKLTLLSKSNEFKEIVSSFGYLPGEWSTQIFKNQSGEILKKKTIIPNPLVSKSSVDQAKIEAKFKDMASDTYMIEFTGFANGEILCIESTSYDECLKYSIPIKSKLTTGYMPAVLGKHGGVAKYKVTRSSGEILSLNIPWGLEIFKYMFTLDENGEIISFNQHKEFLKKFPWAASYYKTKK